MDRPTTTGKATSCSSAPQAGGAWPIIGHMHLFGGQQLTHKTLGAMADKYGPVFTIKLGSHEVLVVNSWEMARDCFTVHDRAFSTRPSVAASKLLGYDLAMFGFAPYGPYWREMRKITTIELLSSHRIDMLRHIRASEVEAAIRDLHKMWVSKGSAESGVMVDMKQWFGELTLNISLRMVGGKRYSGASADCEEAEARRNQKVMRDFVCLFGVFVLSDAIPFLGWLDFNGYEKAMKRTAKELDILIRGWLEEHKQRRLLGGKEKEEHDFMDVMLNILGKASISDFDADTINKATCLYLRRSLYKAKFAHQGLWFYTRHYVSIIFFELYNVRKKTMAGRRSCPGISLALRIVQFTLARLVHSFEVAKPSREDVDMTESNGLTNLKATPLEIFLIPRLNSRLYG
ncbi:unnamed protein product [Dovyalis caffra]|uniref:Cytochrome P450 n=1 Tax=Dovyalis caffra TaxID=77055 RepID=A0AAV1RUF2_9ROSI|nr:unnamed protein product [Dovyalis caffra]